jgi:hypothetical protein
MKAITDNKNSFLNISKLPEVSRVTIWEVISIDLPLYQGVFLKKQPIKTAWPEVHEGEWLQTRQSGRVGFAKIDGQDKFILT